jgi:hypothetical protein
VDSTSTKIVVDALTNLATKLGVTADHMYAVLVRQAAVEARLDVIQSVIGFALLTLGLGGLVAACVGFRKNHYGEWPIWAVVFGSILTVLGACVGIGFACEAYKIGANPEYWALSQVLRAVR